MFEKLQFLGPINMDDGDGNEILGDTLMDNGDEALGETLEVVEEQHIQEEPLIGTEQQVITDNQEYYEVRLSLMRV